MRTRILVFVAVAGAVLSLPAVSVAATPYSYHTLIDRTAATSFNSQTGHLATAVWVTTSAQHMALKPGASPSISRGNLTSVSIIVQDVTRPAGKGYLTVADWFGQVPLAGTFRNNLAAVMLDLTIPVSDRITGDTGIAHVSVAWQATSTPDGRPWHVHVRYPGYVIVNSNENNWLRSATAIGTVTLEGSPIVTAAVDAGAALISTKFHCRQVGFRTSIDWGECI